MYSTRRIQKHRKLMDSKNPILGFSSWCRLLNGAFVHFGDGGQVLDITMCTETNVAELDPASNPSHADYLRRLEYPMHKTLHNFIMYNGEPAIARHRIPGSRINYMTNVDVSRLDPTFMPAPFGIDCCYSPWLSVRVCWQKPLMILWLVFDTQDKAEHVFARFNNGTYTIKGFRVPALLDKSRTQWDANGRVVLGWGVQLSRVPLDSGPGDVEPRMGAHEWPECSLEHRPTLEQVARDVERVRQMISSFGDVKCLEMDPSTVWGNQSSTSHFALDATFRNCYLSAYTLHQQFNNTSHQLPLGPATFCTCLVYQMEIGMPENVYKMIKRHPKLPTVPGFDHYQSEPPYIRLSSYRPSELKEARDLVQLTSQGAVVRKGAGPVWDEWLNSERSFIRNRLRKIAASHGVDVKYDSLKAEVHVYGSGEACNKAQRDMLHSLKTYRNPLIDHYFNHPNPATVGSNSNSANSNTVSTNNNNNTGSPTCPVCMTTLKDSPRVRLRCGHQYCLDCFPQMCTRSFWPQRCCAIDGRPCQELVPLDLINHYHHKDHENSNMTDQLEEALAFYVNRNPDKIRFCPVPDCNGVYRPNRKRSPIDVCGVCLNVICIGCHAAHAGTSCEEHKLKEAEEEAQLEREMALAGVRMCPQCGIPTQKTPEGCNHMVCVRCGADWCWLCGSRHSRPEETYRHMLYDHEV